MAPARELWKLPAALRTYNVISLPLDAATASQECFVCYRNFGDKDDPDDPREIVCEAVQIQPCKHIIGSECLKRVIEMGMDTCQLCRTEISIVADPVPQWLQRMTSSRWFTFQIDTTRNMLPRLGSNGRFFDDLCEDAFCGRLGFLNACTLWCHCMVSPVASTVNLSVLALAVQVFCFPFTWLYGSLKAETAVVAVGLFITMLLSILGVDSSLLRHSELLLGLSLRMITLVLGLQGFIALLSLHCGVYAVVSGLLVGYGFVLQSNRPR
ncbi:hypothetical protein K458DRAFT_392889 [Lentithecium fluviatile CBS 122367]|uniref:RING-type domain-containing protein n=1 Tax=Lentithecium fluviatile CBS 122367 TaxID=1168545 RepID=A0A6G1IRF3_9PLEO|nr:hypothetical protein K458DRAFT_392889 [Lentithecium fluviatile CBS 122367]